MDEQWGTDAMVAHGANWGAHVVISFQDVPPLNQQILNTLRQQRPWIPYVPVDREPASAIILNNLRYAYKIISMSKFGHEQLVNAGFASKMIVEGTDVNIFKPIDKVAMKKKWGLPDDSFIVGMIGANKENPPRKGWQEAILAFKDFQDKHPNAYLFANFQQQFFVQGGFDITGFFQELGIGNKLIIPNDYMVRFASTSEQQNEMYNTYDMLLHPSQTEGFGLCVVEAQSAGVPVVIHNSHSMPELIIEGKTGFGASTLYKQYKNDKSYFHIADPKSVYESMEKVYDLLQKDPEQVKKDCRDHVVANYNIDTLFKEQWVPYLESLQEELLPVDTK